MGRPGYEIDCLEIDCPETIEFLVREFLKEGETPGKV